LKVTHNVSLCGHHRLFKPWLSILLLDFFLKSCIILWFIVNLHVHVARQVYFDN
jgi:hypothetical protein